MSTHRISLDRKLVNKCHSDFGEFQGVSPRKAGNTCGVGGAVDIRVVVASNSFVGSRRRKAYFVPTCMIRASITALSSILSGLKKVYISGEAYRDIHSPRDPGILSDECFKEGVQARIDIISREGDHFSGSWLETRWGCQRKARADKMCAYYPDISISMKAFTWTPAFL